MPTLSIALLNVTSLSTSSRLSKIPPLAASGGISREQFEQGSRHFTHLLRTIDLTNLPDMTSLASSGRLQNAIKFSILHKSEQNGSDWTKSRIIRLLFNQESPRLAGTSVPIYSKALPDGTLPAASGPHLSEFEKRPKLLHATALFAFSLMQCQWRLPISRVENIDNVF